ncbi:MAG: aminoacyl-tRNA hydrolase [Candidatus Moranbacteria bacterium]|nr:aminoacyl-tRNA hydrolase [Candidatus Moranbacteria bacterium]
MKLIVGLGNPGKEYGGTRHNIGFMFLDFLRESWNFEPFQPTPKWKGLTSAGMHDGEKTILLKPETFMNRSGESVRSIMDFFKISVDDIIVIHDDLDIVPGTFKVAKGSGAAGHNGVADLIEKLGAKDFTRIRIGIGRPPENIPADAFVLSPFTESELLSMEKTFSDARQGLTSRTDESGT